MAKNLILDSILARIWAQKNFFPWVLSLLEMLGIVTSYHCMQFQVRRMILTRENGQKTNFGPIFFKNMTSSVSRYHGQLSSCRISEKNQ